MIRCISLESKRSSGQPACVHRRLLLTVSLSATLAGCTFDSPTAPAMAPQVPALDAGGAPKTLGTATLPDPPGVVVGALSGVTPWYSTGIEVPAGATIRVKVSGTVDIQVNPLYMMAFCMKGPKPYCPPEYDGKSAGPLGLNGGSYLRVSVRVAGEGVPLAAPDGSGADSEAGGTVTTTTAGVLEVSREGIFGVSGTSELGGFSNYVMHSSQTLTVELVPPEDCPSPAVSRVLHGASFSTAGSSSTASKCDEEKELVLECNGARQQVSVERGQTISCTAKTDPEGGDLSVTAWSFSGGGSTISGPAGSTTWSGTMVVSGTITVSGTVDGKPKGSSVVVMITPRNWAGTVIFPEVPAPTKSSRLIYPPVSSVGRNVGDGVFGQHTYEIDTSGKIGMGSGPNANWWYFKEPGEFVNATIHINPGLYPDDPFFKAQTGGAYCDRRFMTEARQFVERHETRHHEIAAAYFNKFGAQRFEDATLYQPDTSGSIADLQNALLAPVTDPLRAEQDRFDESNKLPLTCDLNTISR